MALEASLRCTENTDCMIGLPILGCQTSLMTYTPTVRDAVWTAMDRVRADSSEIWEDRSDREGDEGGSRRKGGRADGDGERG